MWNIEDILKKPPPLTKEEIKTREENKKAARILCAIAVIIVAFSVISYYQEQHTDLLVEGNDGSLILVEAISFWGLSWFYQDSFSANYNNVIITTSGFFREKKISVPYAKIKEIICEKGLAYHSITMKIDAFPVDTSYSFNVMNPPHLEQATALLKLLAGQKTIVIEDNSLLYAINNP